MINSFSLRLGLDVVQPLDPKIITIELRNRLWNQIDKFINRFSQNTPLKRDIVIEVIWDRFFQKDIGSLRGKYINAGYYTDQIKDLFYELDWNRVYDFIEFLLRINDSLSVNDLIEDINSVFYDETVQYKIIEKLIVPMVNNEESLEIQSALNNKSNSSKHLKKSVELYSKRPKPDYLNSIKESISAIEAIVKEVLNNPSAKLGDLTNQLSIHPAFKEGIKKFYGWTSDEGGIRHSSNGNELYTNESEARFMLIQCSALVNYIISKYKK